jgi:hypothetical protein
MSDDGASALTAASTSCRARWVSRTRRLSSEPSSLASSAASAADNCFCRSSSRRLRRKLATAPSSASGSSARTSSVWPSPITARSCCSRTMTRPVLSVGLSARNNGLVSPTWRARVSASTLFFGPRYLRPRRPVDHRPWRRRRDTAQAGLRGSRAEQTINVELQASDVDRLLDAFVDEAFMELTIEPQPSLPDSIQVTLELTNGAGKSHSSTHPTPLATACGAPSAKPRAST